MNRTLRDLRRAAEECRPYMAPPLWDALDAAIRKLEPKRRNGIAKPKSPGATREERRSQRTEHVAAVRALVMERAGGRCEVCGREGMILELDHLVSGGLRRHREETDTCLSACADCHRAKHRNDVSALRAYVESCIRLGLRGGLSEMTRRLDKALRVRGVPVRVEEVSRG